nr:serine carboxypeptidase-like 34 [Ipomoea batatas]
MGFTAVISPPPPTNQSRLQLQLRQPFRPNATPSLNKRFRHVYDIIDMYAVHPNCVTNQQHPPPKRSRFAVVRGIAPSPFLQNGWMAQETSGYDPCASDYTEAYRSNRPDVHKALQCPTRNCGIFPIMDLIAGDWKDAPSTHSSYNQELQQAVLRIWVSRGDTDGRVPVTSTRYSLKKLGFNITEDWTPWYTDNQQVGGWTVVYEGLMYVTIRGAGHEVPTFKPREALQLVTHFLANKKLPSHHID